MALLLMLCIVIQKNVFILPPGALTDDASVANWAVIQGCQSKPSNAQIYHHVIRLELNDQTLRNFPTDCLFLRNGEFESNGGYTGRAVVEPCQPVAGGLVQTRVGGSYWLGHRCGRVDGSLRLGEWVVAVGRLGRRGRMGGSLRLEISVVVVGWVGRCGQVMGRCGRGMGRCGRLDGTLRSGGWVVAVG